MRLKGFCPLEVDEQSPSAHPEAPVGLERDEWSVFGVELEDARAQRTMYLLEARCGEQLGCEHCAVLLKWVRRLQERCRGNYGLWGQRVLECVKRCFVHECKDRLKALVDLVGDAGVLDERLCELEAQQCDHPHKALPVGEEALRKPTLAGVGEERDDLSPLQLGRDVRGHDEPVVDVGSKFALSA